MFNSKLDKRKKKVNKYDIAEDYQNLHGGEYDSPESDFSGFYVSLVP